MGSKQSQTAGTSWGGRTAERNSRGVAFIGKGISHGYTGSIRAAMLDMVPLHSIPLNCFLVGTLRTTSDVLVYERDQEEDSELLAVHREAVAKSRVCCFIVDDVATIPSSRVITSEFRSKVKILIFRAPQSDIADKVTGILFPGIRVIFEPEASDVLKVARSIFELSEGR